MDLIPNEKTQKKLLQSKLKPDHDKQGNIL